MMCSTPSVNSASPTLSPFLAAENASVLASSAALFAVFFYMGFPGARRDIPVYAAYFVAGLVFARFLKVHAAPLEDAVVGSRKRVADVLVGADFYLPHLLEHIF